MTRTAQSALCVPTVAANGPSDASMTLNDTSLDIPTRLQITIHPGSLSLPSLLLRVPEDDLTSGASALREAPRALTSSKSEQLPNDIAVRGFNMLSRCQLE